MHAWPRPGNDCPPNLGKAAYTAKMSIGGGVRINACSPIIFTTSHQSVLASKMGIELNIEFAKLV